MIELSRDQIAELRKCAASTVSRAHLPKTEDGKYDLTNAEVWAYVISPYIEKRVEEIKTATTYDQGGLSDLEANKIQEDIEYKKRQSRKLDVEHEIRLKNLVPMELIAHWMGAFRGGIQNNFLQLGNRVARGNKKLRDRIETEVEKSITKTLENAAAQLRQESEKIIESMEEQK